MSADNSYTVLGVKPGMSDEEIRKAYLKLARELNPDLPGNNVPGALERMAKINAAYAFCKRKGLRAIRRISVAGRRPVASR